MRVQPSEPNTLLKPILVMSLMCWGLLTVALTDHPHPITHTATAQAAH